MKNPQTIVNSAAVLTALLAGTIVFAAGTSNSDYQSYVDAPYIVDVPVESRSIAFENPTGEKGQAARAASKLGVGRKGAPSKSIKPGESLPVSRSFRKSKCRYEYLAAYALREKGPIHNHKPQR